MTWERGRPACVVQKRGLKARFPAKPEGFARTSYKGFEQNIHGSRDSIRAAHQFDLIEDGQIWMDMIDDRNHAAHAYDEINAKYLANRIVEYYRGKFVKFEEKMSTFL